MAVLAQKPPTNSHSKQNIKNNEIYLMYMGFVASKTGFTTLKTRHKNVHYQIQDKTPNTIVFWGKRHMTMHIIRLK